MLIIGMDGADYNVRQLCLSVLNSFDMCYWSVHILQNARWNLGVSILNTCASVHARQGARSRPIKRNILVLYLLIWMTEMVSLWGIYRIDSIIIEAWDPIDIAPNSPFLPLTRWGQVTHICVGKLIKFKHFHWRKCVWKCRLRNVVHSVSATVC